MNQYTKKELRKFRSDAAGQVDSEYEALEGMNADELFDYLSSVFAGIPREVSDEVFKDYFPNG